MEFETPPNVTRHHVTPPHHHHLHHHQQHPCHLNIIIVIVVPAYVELINYKTLFLSDFGLQPFNEMWNQIEQFSSHQSAAVLPHGKAVINMTSKGLQDRFQPTTFFKIIKKHVHIIIKYISVCVHVIGAEYTFISISQPFLGCQKHFQI